MEWGAESARGKRNKGDQKWWQQNDRGQKESDGRQTEVIGRSWCEAEVGVRWWGGNWGEYKKRIRRQGKWNRFCFSFKALWKHLVIYHSHSSTCFYFSSPAISSKMFVVLLEIYRPSAKLLTGISCDINSSVNEAHLLIVAVLILFAQCLKPHLSPLRCRSSRSWSYAFCCSRNVLQGHHRHSNRINHAQSKDKWLMVSHPASYHNHMFIAPSSMRHKHQSINAP